jgi:SAM-dependent methyltransferase
MLEQARAVGVRRVVQWRGRCPAAPFEDGEVDAVICQYGVMFFPDKAKAFAQARRVLSPGGIFLFSVWDRIEENEFADAVTASLAPLFPKDPPRFLARTPHGYHDRATIERDIAGGGFRVPPRIETVTARSRASSPQIPAFAYCQGTPLRSEIEARDAAGLPMRPRSPPPRWRAVSVAPWTARSRRTW